MSNESFPIEMMVILNKLLNLMCISGIREFLHFKDSWHSYL